MGVKNIMEIIVWENLENILEEIPGACRCDQCKNDIAAYALNNLKPKYATINKGEVISKASSLELQYHLDVVTALTKGIELVGRNPRHD